MKGPDVPTSPALAHVDAIVAFSIPLTTRFRGVTHRHGLLLHGPAGWGEWSPFDEYADDVAAVWLAAAIDAATVPAPAPRRSVVPVNVTVPAVDAAHARTLVDAAVAAHGFRTAKVKVAEPGGALADDVARVRAVREALGPSGRIRVDANAAWDVATAVDALSRLEDAAGGLEYAEQPCATLDELAEVRARTGVRIAADEAIRRDRSDPALVRDAVDVAVLKVQPSGGVHVALELALALGLPAVVSSALDTSVGLAAGVRLAAALPELDLACGLATGLLLADDVTTRPVRPVERDGDAVLEVDEHREGPGGTRGASTTGPGAQLRGDVPAPDPATVTWLMGRLERVADVLARRGHAGLAGPS